MPACLAEELDEVAQWTTLAPAKSVESIGMRRKARLPQRALACQRENSHAWCSEAC